MEQHDYFRDRYSMKSGSPFQSDRNFMQRRRRAEMISARMAFRWIVAFALLAVVVMAWPR